jgi:hypothetical protein
MSWPTHFAKMIMLLAKATVNHFSKVCRWRLKRENVKTANVERKSWKQELSSETVMTYFNPKLDINIYVDASPVGLGAILCFLQKLHVLPLAGHSILCGNCPPQLRHERFCCFPLSLWLCGLIFCLYPLGKNCQAKQLWLISIRNSTLTFMLMPVQWDLGQ